MTDLRKAAEQALDALEAMMAEFKALDLPYGSKAYALAKDARLDLRAALAKSTVPSDCANSHQPEPQPVAWRAVGGSIWGHKGSEDDTPLYTHPPQQQEPVCDECRKSKAEAPD